MDIAGIVIRPSAPALPPVTVVHFAKLTRSSQASHTRLTQKRRLDNRPGLLVTDCFLQNLQARRFSLVGGNLRLSFNVFSQVRIYS